ncbi:hypothetical protein Sjap_010864 [Stephania japonica]|uniref:Uncharacterized protein n=1 Tax=Stephania japonica TaxID=461633 RepID=A0AAP0J9Z9_9MAGN
MMRRHDEAGSSRPMFVDDESFGQFKKDSKEMQATILKLIEDKTVDHEQLFEMQGRLGRMEQAFMERSSAQERKYDVDVDDDDAHSDSTTEDDE